MDEEYRKCQNKVNSIRISDINTNTYHELCQSTPGSRNSNLFHSSENAINYRRMSFNEGISK
jgi:hypothetical protein